MTDTQLCLFFVSLVSIVFAVALKEWFEYMGWDRKIAALILTIGCAWMFAEIFGALVAK